MLQDSTGDAGNGAGDGERQGWEEVDRQLRSCARRRATLDAEEAAWLRRAQALRIWEHGGYASMLGYMEAVLGYGPRVAIERLRVAAALANMPELAGALFEGTLSYSAVRELSRVITPATELDWISAALDCNLREVEVMVSSHQRGDAPDDPPKPELRMRRVELELSPEADAILRQARDALADERGERPDDSQLVIELCERVLARRAGVDDTGVPTGARHQIAITICERCERGWQDGGGRVNEVDAAAVELARCDAQHIGSLQATAPRAAVTDISPGVRRQVVRRDHCQCTVAGCRASRNLHIHHIVPRAHGGSHKAGNLRLVCGGHHRAIHAGTLVEGGGRGT